MIKRLNIRIVVCTAVLAIGIALMVVGIIQGELTAIMRKATVICLECIGIG